MGEVDVDELARRLEVRVRLISRRIRTEANYGMGISALRVLATLQDRGECRVTYLAQDADVAQPTMTSLINRLEKSGLVTRRRDRADARAVAVSITPAGSQRVADVLAHRAQAVERRLSELSEPDLEALRRALAPLTKLTATAESPDAVTNGDAMPATSVPRPAD